MLTRHPRAWMSRTFRFVAIPLVTIIVAVSCGGDDDNAATSEVGPGSPPTQDETTGPGTTAAMSEVSGLSACGQAAAAELASIEELPSKLPDSFSPLQTAPEPGGTIVKVVNGAIPSDGFSADTQATAAEAIGWTAERLVFDGTVEDLNDKWAQAITMNPTAITGSGWPAAAIQTQIDAAEQAGIVVQLSSVTDVASSYPGFAASANGVPVSELMGQMHANLVMRDSDCTAHVAVFSLPFPILKVATDEFQAVLSEKCPDCEVSYTELLPTDLGTPAITNAIVSKLQSDPSIKYAYTIIGNVAGGLDAALSQANITDVRIFGQVPDENSIRALQDGTNAWWLTQTSQINGWMELDAVLRAIEAEEPVNTTGNPIGILTPENVPADAGDVPIYPANYEELFKEVWLIG